MVAVGVLVGVRRVRTALCSFLRTALREARSVHTRPSRVLALWGGSLAFPALRAAGLAAVGQALGLSVPPVHMALAYLAATCAVALVPTPGGVGSVEAALVIALVAVEAARRPWPRRWCSPTGSSRSGYRWCRARSRWARWSG